jgi:hypothetical protein
VAGTIDTPTDQSAARGPAGGEGETESTVEQIMASGTRMADDGIPRNRRRHDERKIAGVTFGL